MIFNTKLATLAALIATVGVLGVPAPCNDPSHSHEPTSTKTVAVTSTATWGEHTSSTWGEPTSSSTFSWSDSHHTHWHHKSSWSSSHTTSSTPPKAASTVVATSSGAAPTTAGYPTITTTLTVTATPTGAAGAGSCNGGSVQCCNSVQSASSLSPAQNATMHNSFSQGVLEKYGLLGAEADGINVPVGVTCSPLNIIGVGGSTCTSSPVCCNDSSEGGLINIGCIPIMLSL
ncbi:uncharacterized protein PHACADRAFT_177916 [Phanerochaete carnosa HHB-10118-sp]|uniref:Hydrophobin n=1 Tax=Phanerochaete carnosa (strain HHB-10118-sp) TaxID=650164 RepID=K5UND1_PHACS|nr:uncharacterized protein PHACADRAFT_177916 [Phanerochaete carnosa HHB-10118-sp]EKM51251.1 hypothetical protein PHACADRAFT_177916 [Phanerochaete carnosa HHB-10118-sp]